MIHVDSSLGSLEEGAQTPPVRRRRECRDVPGRPRGTAAAGRDLAAAAPGGGGVEGRGLPTAELQRGALGDGKTASL